MFFYFLVFEINIALMGQALAQTILTVGAAVKWVVAWIAGGGKQK